MVFNVDLTFENPLWLLAAMNTTRALRSMLAEGYRSEWRLCHTIHSPYSSNDTTNAVKED